MKQYTEHLKSSMYEGIILNWMWQEIKVN